MKLSRILLWAMVATAGVTGLAYAVVMFLPLPGMWVSSPEKILAGGLCTIAYLTVAILCAVGAESGRAPRLMRSGIIVGAVGLLILIVAMAPESEAIMKVAMVPSTWAGLVALIGLLLLPRRRPGWWAAARRSAIVLLSLLALVFCLTVVFPREDDAVFQVTHRIMGAIALLAGGAVAATLLGVWIPGFAAPPVYSGERRPYWLRCPRCASEQEATTGEHCCDSCGLDIRVEVA
jgi:hypothetical protein